MPFGKMLKVAPANMLDIRHGHYKLRVPEV